MAVTCPVDLDTLTLRREIQSVYARVATAPSGDFHFHRGAQYASDRLGYDAQALAALPTDSTASFAGVANPHRIAPIRAGATVVDIGCGAGMDLLLAAQAVGPTGRAIGIDMTDAMADRARAGADALGLTPPVQQADGSIQAGPLHIKSLLPLQSATWVDLTTIKVYNPYSKQSQQEFYDGFRIELIPVSGCAFQIELRTP